MSGGTRCWLIAKVSLWHLEVRIQARLFSWELRINFPWDKQRSRASGAVQCKFVKKYVCTYVYYNAHCTGLFKSVQKQKELRALLFLSSTQTSQNLKFIQKCPCLSSLKNKFQWTQNNFWPLIRKILIWTF